MEASSASRILEISNNLSGTIRDFILSAAIKIAALSLLIWSEWKRLRIEKQLLQITRDLRASEDRFRQAYDSASVGMGVFSLDGTVLSANRMAAKLLGLEVSELVGTKVSGFMAPECKEDHLQKIASLPLGPENSYQTERRVIRKDGTTAWVRNSVTLLRPEGK
jgi:PAS domain S-box-containing protein